MNGFVAFWLAVIAVNIACGVICFMKGKPWFGVLGVLVFSPLGWIGAIRLAKPGSSWFRRYELEPWKVEQARMRFPKDAYLQDRLLGEGVGRAAGG